MSGTQIRDGAPKIERIDPRLLGGDPIYIFNIYSAEFTQNLGTSGTYYIPPCPEGKDWIRSPHVIPGTVEGTYPHFTEGEEYRARPTPGEDVALCVLGIGPGQGPGEDIRRFGVFTSTNSAPTKGELATARTILAKQLQDKVRKGDELAASADPNDRKSVDESFYRAANWLHVKRPWMSDATEMTLCPFCSTAVRPTASICAGCNQIINPQLYEAQKKQLMAP